MRMLSAQRRRLLLECALPLALSVLTLPAPARATGAAGLLEGLLMVLLVGPLGGLLSVLSLVLAFLVRRRGVPGGSLVDALQAVSALTLLLGAGTALGGLVMRLRTSTWTDWDVTYLCLGLLAVGVALLARRLGRPPGAAADAGDAAT